MPLRPGTQASPIKRVSDQLGNAHVSLGSIFPVLNYIQALRASDLTQLHALGETISLIGVLSPPSGPLDTCSRRRGSLAITATGYRSLHIRSLRTARFQNSPIDFMIKPLIDNRWATIFKLHVSATINFTYCHCTHIIWEPKWRLNCATIILFSLVFLLASILLCFMCI